MEDSDDDYGLGSLTSSLGYNPPEEDEFGFTGDNDTFSSPDDSVSYLLEESVEYDVAGEDVSVMESFFRSDPREYSSGHIDRALSILEQNSELEPVEVIGYVRSNYRAEDEPEVGTVEDGSDWRNNSGFAGAFRVYNE